MYSTEERAQVKQQLERELSSIHLPPSVSERVIQSALARKKSYWEREITCPAPLFAILLVAVIGVFALFIYFPTDTKQLTPPTLTKRIFLDSGIFVESELTLQENRS